MTSFFCILPVYGFEKNCKIFVLFYCVDPRFYHKILQNYGFFFKKNWDIWNPKFQQNSIVYYFFFIFSGILAFCFLFHLSKRVQKLWNFLLCFIGRVRDFTNDFWKNLKILFKKILICEFFFQNSTVYYLFLYFFIIFEILFSILSICTCQKVLEILMFFLFYGLETLSKNFGKLWSIFQKNIDIWNPKFFINFIVYYVFFFVFFSILVIFISYFTYPYLWKDSEHFCDALLYGL